MALSLYQFLCSVALLHAGVFVTEGLCCCNDMNNKFTAILMDYNTRLNTILMNVSNILAENEAMTTSSSMTTSTLLQTSRPTYKDCLEVRNAGNTISKVYNITIGNNLVEAYCDMETDGGGWTVFQKRMDGSVDFLLGWKDYAAGFGNKNGEYWLGNNNLNLLTLQPSELRIELEAFNDTEEITDRKVYAMYKFFAVGNATTNYKLEIVGYSGTAGDSMSGHNNFQFTTKDKDNDIWERNCAVTFEGAWWYSKCHASNLNGKYLGGKTTTYANGVVWRSFTGYHYSLKSSTMMVRRVTQDCR